MSDRRKKQVQSKSEQTYRLLYAYQMHPELLETATAKLFNVLDVTKNEIFKRDDLILFISFLVNELELTGVGTLRDEQIDEMLKNQGVHDLKRIKKDDLTVFMKNYFEFQLNTFFADAQALKPDLKY